ncbi:hypothetical protein [Arthrobacter humicola]
MNGNLNDGLPTILAERLATLRSDLAVGQRDLAALDEQRESLRVALLRLSGAVQVLTELADATEGEGQPRVNLEPVDARLAQGPGGAAP